MSLGDDVPYEERVKGYTLAQLYDVKAHIDRDSFPDRYELVLAELAKKAREPVPSTTSPSAEEPRFVPTPPPEGVPKRIACPHCGNRALSMFRKSFLGPAFTRTCPHCGGQLRTSWWAMAVGAPGGVIGWLLVKSNFAVPVIGLAVVVAVVGTVVHLFWVPLLPVSPPPGENRSQS